MSASGATWRQWLATEGNLLRDLVILLLACIALGLYFLERIDHQVQVQREQQLREIAAVVAENAAEAAAAGDRVSLNVMARRAVAQRSVQALRFESATGQQLAVSGEAEGPAPTIQTIKLANGSVVGLVQLWPSSAAPEREPVEAGFVLLTLCLLGFRVLFEGLSRHLRGEPILGRPPAPVDDDWDAMMPATPPGPAAVLRIGLAHRAHLDARYTPGLLETMLKPWQQLLERAVALYDGRCDGALGEDCAVLFEGDAEEAAYRAVCAGTLFLMAAGKLSEWHHQDGRVALGFSALVTGDADDLSALGWCEQGPVGELMVPVAELLPLALDRIAAWQADAALTLTEDDDVAVAVRLQPLGPLVQRHQERLERQSDELLLAAVTALPMPENQTSPA
ncbi:hypothetical protein [Isoalcanivorax beigongshangi]|uniref:Uncharacterized protein n=1 Tax=Isoalcanivorax beigongshangi TaxID=3238810 RepID=A0ABV4ADQ7_9GAMM